MRRSRTHGRPTVRAFHRAPMVEQLEDRCLLDAGPISYTALPADPKLYDPSNILIRLRPEYAETANFTLIGGETGTPSAVAAGLWKIQLDSGVTVADALAIYRSDPRVLSDQPDYRITVQTTPNDPYFTSNQLYGLNKIGAPTAWNTSTGSSNVVVAIIDTGIDYNHQDLSGNIWTNPGNVANDGMGNDYHGANFTSLTTTTGNVLDDNGHGSHVAGVIGAVGNNGTGVSGVNWHVQLMALKFLDANGSGYTSGAVRAIDYAIQHGANIINASWGGGGFDQALSDAIGRAQQAGVIFVVAAGNSGANNDKSPFYPASYSNDNVVVVAASDQNDQRATFSNYGSQSVDVYAPGVGIWSTTPNNTYTSYSGTSMATPYVTGALALLKAAHPDWNYHQLIDRLRTTVDHVSGLNNVLWGGRLNVGAALANSSPPQDTTAPTVTRTVASNPSAGQLYKVRITFSEAIDPASFTKADLTLTGLNGFIAITSVAVVSSSNNTQFDVNFPTQTAPGTFKLRIGPHIKDTAGNEMTAPFDATFSLKSSTTTFGSGTINLGIKDLKTTTSTINVSQDGTIGKLTVKLDLAHTWDGDLVIKLRGPDGTTVTLFNRRGGSGDNIKATFDDSAGAAITSGTAPFNGSFRPEQALAAFNNKGMKGAWQLTVQDKAAGDEGTLKSWSITIGTSAARTSASVGRSGTDDAAVSNGSRAKVSAGAQAVDAIFASSVVRYLFSREEAPALPTNRPNFTVADRPTSIDIPVLHSSSELVDNFFASNGGGSDEEALVSGWSPTDEGIVDGWEVEARPSSEDA